MHCTLSCCPTCYTPKQGLQISDRRTKQGCGCGVHLCAAGQGEQVGAVGGVVVDALQQEAPPAKHLRPMQHHYQINTHVWHCQKASIACMPMAINEKDRTEGYQ